MTVTVQLQQPQIEAVAGVWTVLPTPPATTWRFGAPQSVWPDGKIFENGRDVHTCAMPERCKTEPFRVRPHRLSSWGAFSINSPPDQSWHCRTKSPRMQSATATHSCPLFISG
jgi:hypothetical protein